MSERPLSAVILAAGEGTRMRSSRPKPLHLLCGRPMVLHILDAVAQLRPARAVVVVGHGADQVTKTVSEAAPPGLAMEFVDQHEQRGTGDAVSAALTAFDDDADEADLLVLPGDTPLLRPATLVALVEAHRRSAAAATVLTAVVADPTGYGRVVRSKDGRVARIVEHRDATEDERVIDEVNTSIYCFRKSVLAPSLRRLSPENADGEYYLTDVVSVLHDAGYNVVSLVAADPIETAGVNDRAQLAAAEAEVRDRINDRLMVLGVNMVGPERTYVDASVAIAPDVTIFPGTVLQGATVIAEGAVVGPSSHLVDTRVGAGASLRQTVSHSAEIGAGAQVGPFAVLEPRDRVADGVVTGPFFRGSRDDDDEGGT